MCNLKVGGFAVLLRLNTHGFRRYALRAYAPLRPAIASDTPERVILKCVGFGFSANKFVNDHDWSQRFYLDNFEVRGMVTSPCNLEARV